MRVSNPLASKMAGQFAACLFGFAATVASGTALADVGVFAGNADEAPSFVELPRTSLNFFGSPGLVDMPSAHMMQDGMFATTVALFGGQYRYSLTFQATPWLSASFRYVSLQDWNRGDFDTYFDRNFDVRFRLHQETRRWPEITLGLQDFAGTGIYAAEYIVATKTLQLPRLSADRLPGRIRLTAGLGWGRLGSAGSIGAPFGDDRPAFVPGDTGGTLAVDQWFRGPMAPFGGVEWMPNERTSVKLEYSSDDYEQETQISSVFERKSRFNFGIEYQMKPRTRLGLYYLYGSELGASLQVQLNPRVAIAPLQVPGPQPIRPRPDRAANPEAWSPAWASNSTAPNQIIAALEPALLAQGLALESLAVEADSVELGFRNLQYMSFANAVGRAARTLALILPASVETFRLVPMSGGMALSAVTLRRSDLEELEFAPRAAEELLAVTGFSDARTLAENAVVPADLYPDKSWSLAPFFETTLFDPDNPLAIDVGLELTGTYRPAPGWILTGSIRQRIAGNRSDLDEDSESLLPHVRTSFHKYLNYDTTLADLFAARQWRAGRDLYARVSVGYLEPMYGGVSAELLWKPVNSRLALGVEANYARQRDYDQQFGFRDYSIFTGHASAYYDFGRGYHGQLDIGRYLAGDVGATVTLDREFDNGWALGGFFTLTDVSAEEFGEGSFDKGIRLRIPINWFVGAPSRQARETVIRPTTRDGGARLEVRDRLYNQVRDAHQRALTKQWVRVWE